MSYVDKILQPGEIVLNQTRLHWFIYLRSIILIIIALAVLGASFFTPQNVQLYVQIVAAVLGFFGLGRLVGAWIKRRSTALAVTNFRVIHKTGFFSRNTQEMNRAKVESVEVKQSLTGRIFGYGTVLVRGVGSTWEPFAHIADPLSFRSNITATDQGDFSRNDP
jgi:uncharacterized membrane protein YdbT with pleckstrin-like domain